jgi:hypothetical protein
VVVPSGLTTRVQPQRWMTIWWWCDTKVAHERVNSQDGGLA